MRKRKSWTSFNFHVYTWPFIHCFFFIYARSHGKITRQWKSTLRVHMNGITVGCRLLPPLFTDFVRCVVLGILCGVVSNLMVLSSLLRFVVNSLLPFIMSQYWRNFMNIFTRITQTWSKSINRLMSQRDDVMIWSTWEIWSVGKRRKGCSRRSQKHLERF